MTPDQTHRSEAGFSLLEVLTSLAILALVVSAALQVPPSALAAFGRADQRSERSADLASGFLTALREPICGTGRFETDQGTLTFAEEQSLGSYALFALTYQPRDKRSPALSTHRLLPRRC